MRFVLCDDDRVFTSIIEAMLTDLGHGVVGVGTTTADSVALVRAARPDVVILDLSLGFNTDFDIVVAAAAVGATPIVFTHNADEAILRQYAVRPRVVFKPDLTELERVVERIGVDTEHHVVERDRRERPGRAASGPVPTNISDAQAFYEALNDATAGDSLVAIALPKDAGAAEGVPETANRVREVLRQTDRLLASSAAVRVFLPAGGDVGAASFRTRLGEVDALPAGATIRSVVVAPGESSADAFDRLKAVEPEPYGPKIERSPAVAPPSTDHSAPVT